MGQGKSNAVWSQNAGMELVTGKEMCYSDVYKRQVLKKSFYGCSNYPECTFTLAEHFRKKKLTKTNVKELLEGKETLVKGIKTKDRKSYNAVVKIGEKGYIDFIYV